MTRILLTGAHGQLGQEFFALHSGYPSMQWVWADRSLLDLSQPGAIAAFFEEHAPFDYCIHCAAYTAVDRAESEPELAWRINAEALSELAQACRKHRIRLIHFSSDYVYHNSINRPLRESDPTTPVGVYGKSKLAGEKALLDLLPDSLIFRTSWVYSAFGTNFVKTMRRLGAERAELRVVCDQIGAPTYARDLARAVLQLIAHPPANPVSGIFNYANEGVCSWYDFAQAIFEYSHINCQVLPIPSSAYPSPATRPTYSVLDTNHFKQTFSCTIPYWRDSLKECIRVMHELSSKNQTFIE